MTKYREFWIDRGDIDLGELDYIFLKEPFGTHSSNSLHVIEYAAYDELKQQCEALAEALEKLYGFCQIAGYVTQNTTKFDFAKEALKKYQEFKGGRESE